MAERYVVVDGSNIATEGRDIPSLAQLDEAVRAFMAERASDEEVIVVVDATFGHRIDPREKAEFEQAERAGELVSPPAGAVGRGDAFLLQVADRTNAVVLSNDSFQEFHAEYQWLFDDGRLIGGKPVPRVGWFFTPRTPVRGPKSREVTRAAKKARKTVVKRAAVAEGPVAEAIAEATAEAISPDSGGAANGDSGGDGDGEGRSGKKRARRRRSKPVGAVNDPLPFIQFIADHPLGSSVEGEVEGFTSHGAFVMVGQARCYVPLSALGDPAPRTAKGILRRTEVRTFVVQALDPPRRGIELALPEVARVAGAPTEETVEADMGAVRKGRGRSKGTSVAEADSGAGGASIGQEGPPTGPDGDAAGDDVADGEPGDGGAGAGEAPAGRRRRRSRRAPGPAGPAAEPEPADGGRHRPATAQPGAGAAEPVPAEPRSAAPGGSSPEGNQIEPAGAADDALPGGPAPDGPPAMRPRRATKA
ncbi:MAG: hypothetical protein AB1673_16595, partial [Actinomycetota bacterium]